VSPTRTIARRIAAAVLGAAFVSGVNAAQGQPANWPTRPIKIITPLSAGGAADVLGRTVGDELFAKLKQPVVIENRPGGGGVLAASTVARALADGYTLLLGTAGLLTITPVLSKNVTFDPLQDFAPITNAVESPICLVVHKSLAVNSVAELITYAKANPGKLSFGSSGPNTTHHLAGEFLKRQAGIEMIHVPYRGGNPAMTDLLAGQIPVLFATLSTVLPYITAGNVKVLGMIEAKRSKARPEIPTIGESVPGYAVPSSFLGFLAPAKTPPALVDQINKAFVQAIEAPHARETFESNGFEVVTSTPAEFGHVVKSALDRYRKIAIEAHIEEQ